MKLSMCYKQIFFGDFISYMVWKIMGSDKDRIEDTNWDKKTPGIWFTNWDYTFVENIPYVGGTNWLGLANIGVKTQLGSEEPGYFVHKQG